MPEHFEIRQQVRTVHKRWLEVIAKSAHERTISADYDRYVSQNPGEYFELVNVTHDEKCLGFTPIFDTQPETALQGNACQQGADIGRLKELLVAAQEALSTCVLNYSEYNHLEGTWTADFSEDKVFETLTSLNAVLGLAPPPPLRS